MIKALSEEIKQVLYHQQKAHRHAADSMQHLETIWMNTTIPMFIRIAEATVCPLVTLRLTSVDDVLDKTLRIKKQREETCREYEKPDRRCHNVPEHATL